MNSITISNEQQIIVDDLLSGHNVIVDAVAGSGKTTTILWYCLKCKSSQRILVLTYNKRLKLETRAKVIELNLQKNVEVHSYHSMGVKYYTSLCQTDSGIIDTVNKNYNRRRNYQYDVIIIDEAQDMTTTYFAFINKIIIDSNNIPQLFIIGDKYQSIFAFNNADSRFITYAKQIFPSNKDTKWINNDLKTSFRVTIPMANFYNNCIFGYKKIISIKESSVKPTYFICNTFAPFNPIIKEIMYLLRIYLPSDIFVLAPTIKSLKTPIRRLANELSTKGYKIYVSNGNEDRLDSDVIANKLVFTTFHSVKGLERKVVFVYGMDNSYFTYFAKTLDVKICPNTIYVAITRATEKLYMIHHSTDEYLPFINVNKLTIYCNVIGLKRQNKKKTNTIRSNDTSNIVGVLDLIRYMDSNILKTAISGTQSINIDKYKYTSMINLIHKITTYEGNNLMTESVANLNGIALPMYLELLIKESVNIYNIIYDNKHNKQHYDEKEFKKYLCGLSSTGPFNSYIFLYLANIYDYYVTGYNYKKNQISKYDWLTDETFVEVIQKSIKILWNEDRPLNKESIFFETYVSDTIENRIINGSIDLIDKRNKIVWELKCVLELTEEHFLQLLIYAYLFDKEGYKYYLFNMISGEVIELIFDRENAGKSISYLIREKYSATEITDQTFISNMKNITSGKKDTITTSKETIEEDIITTSKETIEEDIITTSSQENIDEDTENPFDINKIID